jgi:predicted alternative tryptophan synthase beta-subunit
VSDVKIQLPESSIPTHWYNVVADMPNPPEPYLGPDGKPVTPEAMGALFPPGILEQEVSTERWIEIPEPVRGALALWRPSPLYRAKRLEERLGTPAKIFFKHEGVSPAGSHKPNSAVPQAYYNHIAGIHRLTTETGAGQWGSSLALAGRLFDMAERHAVKVIISNLMESAVGRRAIAHLATAWPELEGPHGLATGQWFSEDVAPQPDFIEAARLHPGSAPGIGFEPAWPNNA